MNQTSPEKLNKIVKYTFAGAIIVGLVSAFVVGFAYRIDKGFASIVSLGADQKALQEAFIEGAKKGGLYGGLGGGLIGCLFGISVALFGKTER